MRRLLLPAAIAAAGLISGCNKVDFKAADQASRYRTATRVSSTVQAPDGFRAVIVAEGLNYPSSIAWDAAGRMLVLESGSVPIPTLSAKVMRVDQDGALHEVSLQGGFPGEEAVGLAVHDGWVYASHDEKDGTWSISRFHPDGGAVEPVVKGIPARGDHWIGYLQFDAAGNLWFGVGSATNSGVVSSHDPVNNKWIKKRTDAHDIPCRDVVLTGRVFREEDALGPKGQIATTGAFQAFRHSDAVRIPGRDPCTSALFRLRPDAKTPELVAWGFRNPVALALDAGGNVVVGMQGADIRGTRPIADDPDAIYRVREGAWYGWPDYGADLQPVTIPARRPPEKFLAAAGGKLDPVVDLARSGLTAPDRSLLVATTDAHAALCGMTPVPATGPFARWAGELLISEMGDFKPSTDPANPTLRAGFQVESVDLKTGGRAVFARNRGGERAEPASHLKSKDGFERPVDVKIGPDGLVYVLDFGAFESTGMSAKVFPKTGKVFRIEPAR
jgi:glucose/arabinose dehydrogenase